MQRMVLGDAGVLAPGRWRWARALGWMVALVVLAILTASAGGLAAKLSGVDRAVVALFNVAALAVLYALYVLLVRRLERRPVTELAPAALPADLAVGLLIGTGMMLLVFGSLRLLGVYTLAPGQWSDWPHDVAMMTVVGFFEELIARAIIFRLLMRAFGQWPAIVLSSLLFGAAHLGNPNATWLGAAAIAIEAGTMLAGFYLLTGRIWMSVGVHIAWNLMQGPVLGARVSGHPEVGSLFVSGPVAGAPEWLSGGIFGPEASVSAMVVGVGVFALTYAGARRRGAI